MRWMESALAYICSVGLSPCKAAISWRLLRLGRFHLISVPATRIIKPLPMRAATFFKKFYDIWILGLFCNNSVLDYIHIKQ